MPLSHTAEQPACRLPLYPRRNRSGLQNTEILLQVSLTAVGRKRAPALWMRKHSSQPPSRNLPSYSKWTTGWWKGTASGSRCRDRGRPANSACAAASAGFTSTRSLARGRRSPYRASPLWGTFSLHRLQPHPPRKKHVLIESDFPGESRLEEYLPPCPVPFFSST